MFNTGSFKCSESGNTAVLFAILLLPLLTLAGVTFDFSRLTSAKSHAASALDATSLAAAKMMSTGSYSDEDLTQFIHTMYASNVQTTNSALTCTDPTAEIDRVSGKVLLSSSCKLPTTAAGVLRRPEMDLMVTSVAIANTTTLDLAMMLDVSGSMQGAKLDSLKSAATNAIDTMITDASNGRVRISLVPYAEAVNVGDFGDVAKGKSLGLGNGNCNGNGNGNANNQGKGNANGLGNGNGNGNAYGHSKKSCASERSGPQAFKSAKPAVGSWIGDKATTCPDQGITPILSDKAVLKDTLGNLNAGGATAGHLGIAWSWYTISESWNDIWPSDSQANLNGKKNNIRAVILMTDGAFNTGYDATLGSSFDQSEKLCDEMKDDGVIIFSVAFEAPAAGQTILKSCATSDEHYFVADDGDALLVAYESIASKLTNLRIGK